MSNHLIFDNWIIREICEINGEMIDIKNCEYMYYAFEEDDIYPRYVLQSPREDEDIQIGCFYGTQYFSYIVKPVWYWSGYDSNDTKYKTQKTKNGYTILLDSFQLEEIKNQAWNFMIYPSAGIFDITNY